VNRKKERQGEGDDKQKEGKRKRKNIRKDGKEKRRKKPKISQILPQTPQDSPGLTVISQDATIGRFTLLAAPT